MTHNLLADITQESGGLAILRRLVELGIGDMDKGDMLHFKILECWYYFETGCEVAVQKLKSNNFAGVVEI